jgi:hypothetical protein
MSNKSMTKAELVQLLDVYGADRARWPAEARELAAHLVTSDAEVGRLLAEAEALDRLLERAPVPGLAVEVALAERILASAQRSPRIVRLPGSGRAAATPASPVETAADPDAAGGRWRQRLFTREVGAISFLAASLAFGVVIGSSSLPPQLLPALFDMAGLASDRNGLVQIALSDEVMQ